MTIIIITIGIMLVLLDVRGRGRRGGRYNPPPQNYVPPQQNYNPPQINYQPPIRQSYPINPVYHQPQNNRNNNQGGDNVPRYPGV